MQSKQTIAQLDGPLSLDDLRMRWLKTHRGVFTEIAEKFDTTHQTVRNVYWGHTGSPNPQIVRELTKRGAPGFTNDQTTAA
jgi:hypothetical protein